MALELIGDHQGELTTVLIRVRYVTDDTVFDLLSVLLSNRNEGHLSVVVDLSEANQHLRG